jgi:hypothetical protein
MSNSVAVVAFSGRDQAHAFLDLQVLVAIKSMSVLIPRHLQRSSSQTSRPCCPMHSTGRCWRKSRVL